MAFGVWDRSGVVRSPDIERGKAVRISKYGWWPSCGHLKFFGVMQWTAISQFGRERFYKKVYRYRNTSERKGATRNPRSGPERHETVNSQPLQTRLQAAPRPSVTENGFRVRGSPLPLKALWPVGTDPKSQT